MIGAIDILRNTTLMPIDKARKIAELDGFGESTATGLVDVDAPHRVCGLQQTVSVGVPIFGLNATELDGFQEAARQILDELEAEDFLELDAFIYLIARGDIAISSTVSRKKLDIDTEADKTPYGT